MERKETNERKGGMKGMERKGMKGKATISPQLDIGGYTATYHLTVADRANPQRIFFPRLIDVSNARCRNFLLSLPFPSLPNLHERKGVRKGILFIKFRHETTSAFALMSSLTR